MRSAGVMHDKPAWCRLRHSQADDAGEVGRIAAAAEEEGGRAAAACARPGRGVRYASIPGDEVISDDVATASPTLRALKRRAASSSNPRSRRPSTDGDDWGAEMSAIDAPGTPIRPASSVAAAGCRRPRSVDSRRVVDPWARRCGTMPAAMARAGRRDARVRSREEVTKRARLADADYFGREY